MGSTQGLPPDSNDDPDVVSDASQIPERPRETLSQKLDRLFRTVHPRGRGEYSPDEVSAAIASRGGPTISSSYLHMLRKGQRDNPTKKHLEALADFFGVPPAYFFDDDEAARISAELDLLIALRDLEVRQIALRATGLSAESLATVREVVERVRQLEGLGESDVHPTGS
jgi:transcriptional regulator with XRE-family HTH domain